MSKQPSRRFNKRTQGRRDNDYSRKTTTTTTTTSQGGDDGRKRQLFDPFSDNPIAFNRSTFVDKQQETQPQITTATSGRRSYLAQRRDGLLLRNMDDNQRREKNNSNNNHRRLWDPNDDKKPPMQLPQRDDPPVPTVARRRSPPTSATTTTTTTTPTSAPNPVKDQHKRKIKAMFASIQDIEGKLVNVDAEASKLEFFKNDHDEHDRQQRQRMVDSVDKKEQRPLTQVDLAMAGDMWRQKVELHIALADKYLDLMQFDYAFAEKKSLESLCWKRAIYSLVEQFRTAFKIRMTDVDDPEEEGDALEEEEDDNVIAESTVDIPLFSDMGNDDYEDEEDEEQKAAFVTKSMELDKLKEWFADFLDQADDFYRRSMSILRSMDTYSEMDEEQHLQEWRRTHRLKWYKAVPNRGDLARYRWTFASRDELTFREAWQWYALGVWLMPATGKLYFHLSLLIHGANAADPTRDLHRLYFSIRSLMVRRNGFLNAREGMIVLFESNRRWVDKYLKTVQSNKGSRFGNRGKKMRQEQQQQQERLAATSQDIAAGLFIRLHGMLFTKISLDQFAQIKRRFFDCLFPDASQNESNGVTSNDDTTYDSPAINDGRLDIHEMFWFEAAVICISSLYNYDYASSKFTKLSVLQSKRLYAEPAAATATATEDPAKSDSYNDLVEELKDSILFAYNVDLMTSIAVQLFRRFLDRSLLPPITPNLPLLPPSPRSLNDNYSFIFERRDLHASLDDGYDNDNSKKSSVNEPWIIFIEMMLHWMVVNSVCQRPEGGISLWEALVGNPAPDLLKRHIAEDDNDSKISPMFWPLLLDFLNNQLQSFEDDVKYEVVNQFLLDDDDDCNSNKEHTQAEYAFGRLVAKVLGKKPILPEEMHMRGLGWVDDITGKLLKITPLLNGTQHEAPTPESSYDLHTQRKIKVLSYGFALAKQMSHVFCYDPVLEIFVVNKGLEEEIDMHQEEEDEVQSPISNASQETESDDINNEPPFAPTIEAMDDAVLFSNENDSVDEDGDDDMLTQLKKRREQLQAMLTTTSGANTNHRRALGRLKEREARLNRLRERVIPGQTVIVLDTNCFIGHIDHVQRLIQSNKWSIVIPLVVITELDGLRSNTPPLGEIAGEALKFIETTLATKQRSNTHLRIQTSHNNFMHDISIRSEQFVFGETDKNLDDLVLSACLWWARDSEKDEDHARVCLVTGDRNLSVKARARDIDVMSVSAIMQLTPKK